MNKIPIVLPQTIVIDNFSGRLTRSVNGELNSGQAKFASSWGYDPFSKPGQLTWCKGPAPFYNNADGLVLASVSRVESGVIQTYALTNAGKIIKFSGTGYSATVIVTLSTGSPTFTYGGSIVFFGATDTLYVGHDKGVTKVKTDGSSEAQVGTWNSTQFTPIVTQRLLVQFGQYLYASNSDPSVTYANNLAQITSAGTVNSYAILSPSLPTGTYIRDLDLSKDLIYMLISSSDIPSELLAPVNDAGNSSSGDSALYMWNGVDTGVTAGESLPSFGTTALQSFSGNQTMFMYDTFGSSLFSGGRKVATLENNKSAMPNATATTGNFLSWVCPEVVRNPDTGTYTMVGSMYYFGTLDDTMGPGLYRMFRQSSAIGASGVVYQMPWNSFSTSRYLSVNTTPTISEIANGVHLFSWIDYSGSGGSTLNRYYAFDVAPSDTFSNPTLGVYETQNQLFSKKISIKQIRVYTEPTLANNGFQVDIIGGNGKLVTNGTFTYSFASGSDITRLQGSLERINFNPSCQDLYSVGIRVTNSGSANMTINKIEVDWDYSGR